MTGKTNILRKEAARVDADTHSFTQAPTHSLLAPPEKRSEEQRVTSGSRQKRMSPDRPPNAT